MRGGARVNSGPAPDPDALRRDRPGDAALWRILPGPCPKKPPAWPLLPDVGRRAQHAILQEVLEGTEQELVDATGRRKSALTKAARELKQKVTVLQFQMDEQQKIEQLVWRELWKSPQAHAWHELGWSRDVAQYVRHKVLGEMGSLDDAKEARQWSDRLGLNPAAMLRNRWKVAAGDEQKTGQRRPAATSARSRKRLTIVKPPADAKSG